MKPWHLGNTTVRSPFRLRDGLIALSASSLQGNLRGLEQEQAFCRLLGEQEIVELRGDVTYSVGRKWRSALGKMGFLYPEIPADTGIRQHEIGPLDMITPNGWRLIRAETVPAMQECFLRALAAYYVAAVRGQNGDNGAVFSPLQHTLTVMLGLEAAAGESRLDFIEMALVVQLTSSDDDPGDVIAQVLALREQRKRSDNKRQFDRQVYEDAAAIHGYKSGTFDDYADLNFRYLKATGLVQSKGRGITLTPEKRVFIGKLVQDTAIPDSDHAYFQMLCEGARLPTDNKEMALAILDDLRGQLKVRGIPFEMKDRILDTPADIALVRYAIEKLLAERNEDAFAEKQAAEWKEIVAYMELLISGKRSKMLPKNEAPAYFEWTLWRAFLAIDGLKNKAYEARRFNIDQDFLPVGPAPGGGPDLIFEFADFVLVVEVTLTGGSRQEAAEGEPVRRHVADLVVQYREQTGKPVYGLFIANRIDSNTAETFRIGVWYTSEDDRMQLDIVPLTLTQFKKLFEALFKSGYVEVNAIRELLDQCNALRPNYEAPVWKRRIEQTVRYYTEQILLR